ncbi:MAG: UDP-N-acetylmuramoyl-tripeptide--D-alanyl-D-alanine ligase [Thermodesulfovibrio sp.]|nr:UDP-N-acetylmuramoyl-tripeptide--D-alanyl-D-alanine ligase [Thermodesulfovibrio sp.]MDW7973094.1 UDP-N-acetylmuramoyl-tripeptide--D-alanyl-D-alanine ligase [Thermodesulfovibrio sp.]
MFTLDDLLTATQGRVISKGKEIFREASIDTRTIDKEDIFFALRGSKRDGHEFVDEALNKAAGAVVSKVEGIEYKDKTVVLVDDTLKSLQSLAKYLRRNFKGKVIAVIGSNGKTTTKELIASFLSKKYRTLKTEGNFNNNIGVPLCISKIEKNTEIMVLELGTNKPGDIRELCEIVYPDYALITNIGYEHIEGFGSIEGVREGELEILPYVRTVFVNGDDDFLMEGLKRYSGKIVTFGLSKKCDFRAENINFYNEHVEFDFCGEIFSFPVKSHLPGIHNIYNLTGAITVATFLGISKGVIQEVSESFSPIKMRGEIIKIDGVEIFFDAYNANPSSMKVALQELVRRKKDRKAVAVLGDMMELGSFTDLAHEEIGKWIREMEIDLFIGVGKFIRNALRYANGYVFDDPKEATEFLREKLKGNEVVLIKGSRTMQLEKILEILKEGRQ